MSEHFRRTDPRYDRRIEVDLQADGKRTSAVTKNISLGGMFVETLDPLIVGATVQVKFKVPTQPEPIEVTGEIRWLERGAAASAGGMTGMGIRFHGLRAREVWALNRFFQS